MGKIFDEDGKVKNPDDLRSITIDGRAGTRSKVTDESTERVKAFRVESDTERSLNLTPRTADFKIVEA